MRVKGNSNEVTDYREYIAGEEWRRRRGVFLETHLFCNRCGLSRRLAKLAYSTDLHVHHKSYARLGSESDEDLEALCKRCHEIESFRHTDLDDKSWWIGIPGLISVFILSENYQFTITEEWLSAISEELRSLSFIQSQLLLAIVSLTYDRMPSSDGMRFLIKKVRNENYV